MTPGRPPARLGILGGTFDPVHVGHLVVAQNVRHALGLDRVLLVVANQPWKKVGRIALSDAEDRFAVLEAATDAVEGLEASRIEIDRGGPSYSADTVAELRRRWPAAELFLIVGADLVGELATWQRVAELQEATTLVVADRGGVVAPEAPPGWRVERVAVPALEISSSELRDRFAEGAPVDFLVPEAAVREIRRRGLYALGR